MTDHDNSTDQPAPPPAGPTSPATPLAAPPPASPLPAPPPPTSRRIRTRYIVIAVVVVLLVIGGIAEALAGHNSRFTIVPSSSTDGTFHAGDCVTLASSSVHYAPCSDRHDAQIIEVIHGSDSCPSGTQEFDVTDNTGNLCLDKSNSSS